MYQHGPFSPSVGLPCSKQLHHSLRSRPSYGSVNDFCITPHHITCRAFFLRDPYQEDGGPAPYSPSVLQPLSSVQNGFDPWGTGIALWERSAHTKQQPHRSALKQHHLHFNSTKTSHMCSASERDWVKVHEVVL